MLRKRKNRPDKPFAVMVLPDKIDKIVKYSKKQISMLKSPAAPIVILDKKYPSPVSDLTASGYPCIGVFLPYAPVHYLILRDILPFLIMTSGNIKDEPIAIDEKDLKGMCDYFLTNNRPIQNRSDDSVIFPLGNDKALKPKIKTPESNINEEGRITPFSGNILMRKSRGYVPLPMNLPINTVPTLGCGAELKLTFSLSKNKTLFMSPYIGNADNKRTIEHYTETIDTYKKLFKIKPELVVADLHPDYFTTRFAKKMKLPVVQVQHHFAHIASVMAEHGLNEPVIGIAYDGTGYGLDKNIWGGEIMIAEYKGFERKFHLNYMPLPGGDASIKYPSRIAYAYLKETGCDADMIKNLSDLERKIIGKEVQNKFNLFYTSSMGRFFDCVSAILNLVKEITYEAQSAIHLEFLCEKTEYNKNHVYPYEIRNEQINIRPVIKGVMEDVKKKVDKKIISWKFHNTIIRFTLDAVRKISGTFSRLKGLCHKSWNIFSTFCSKSLRLDK